MAKRRCAKAAAEAEQAQIYTREKKLKRLVDNENKLIELEEKSKRFMEQENKKWAEDNLQAEAERKKRASILSSEGDKISNINHAQAENEKQEEALLVELKEKKRLDQLELLEFEKSKLTNKKKIPKNP